MCRTALLYNAGHSLWPHDTDHNESAQEHPCRGGGAELEVYREPRSSRCREAGQRHTCQELSPDAYSSDRGQGFQAIVDRAPGVGGDRRRFFRVSTMSFRDDDFSVGVARHFIVVVLDPAMDRSEGVTRAATRL
jgi:hypothetical protein